jgi:hypothetical protein
MKVDRMLRNTGTSTELAFSISFVSKAETAAAVPKVIHSHWRVSHSRKPNH